MLIVVSIIIIIGNDIEPWLHLVRIIIIILHRMLGTNHMRVVPFRDRLRSSKIKHRFRLRLRFRPSRRDENNPGDRG